VEAEITAGYKEDDKWVINELTGVKCFRKQVVRFEPGEVKELSYYYPVPPKNCSKDIEIKEINIMPYLVDCD